MVNADVVHSIQQYETCMHLIAPNPTPTKKRCYGQFQQEKKSRPDTLCRRWVDRGSDAGGHPKALAGGATQEKRKKSTKVTDGRTKKIDQKVT